MYLVNGYSFLRYWGINARCFFYKKCINFFLVVVCFPQIAEVFPDVVCFPQIAETRRR